MAYLRRGEVVVLMVVVESADVHKVERFWR
jgi:hypothetical protein